eukprot:1711902-Rhodomonas_salina.3
MHDGARSKCAQSARVCGSTQVADMKNSADDRNNALASVHTLLFLSLVLRFSIVSVCLCVCVCVSMAVSVSVCVCVRVFVCVGAVFVGTCVTASEGGGGGSSCAGHFIEAHLPAVSPRCSSQPVAWLCLHVLL